MNANPLTRLVIFTAISLMVLVGCSTDDDNSSNMLEADAYLDVAEIYRTQGQFRAGIIEAQNALQAFPESAKTRRFTSRLYMDTGNISAAQELLEQLLTVIPEDPEATLLLAESYLNGGDQNTALEILQNFQPASDAERVQSEWIIGNAYARNNNQQAAQEALNSVLDLDPNHTASLVSLSMLEFQTGNEFGAQEFLDRAIAIDPADLDLMIWRGQFALLRQQYPESEEAFFDALQVMGGYDTMTPKRLAVLRAIIVPLQMQQKNDEALRYSQLIAESPQGQLQNSFSSAISMFQERNFTEAEQAIGLVLSQSPDHPGSNILLGLTRYAQGNFQGAEQSLSGLVDAETSSPEVVKVLAATQLRLGQADRALDILEKAAEIYPEDGSLIAMIAISQQSLGNIEESIELFEQAMTLQVDSPDLHFALAGSYFQNDEIEPAIQQLQRALEIDPSYDSAKNTLIDLLMNLERVAEARSLSSEWLGLDSDSIANNNVAARIEYREGNLTQASDYFNITLGFDSENVEAHLFLARVGMQEEDYETAERHLLQVIGNNPANMEALSGYLALGDMSQTTAQKVADVSRIIDEQASEFVPALILAQFHYSKNEFTRALPHAETAYGRNVNDFTTNTLLEIIVQLATEARVNDDIVLARELTTSALQLQPESIQILILAAGVESQAGSYGAALLHIGRIKELQPEGSTLGIELEGDLAAQQLEFESALESFQQAWEIAANPGLGVKIHRTYTALERDEEAIDFLESWVSDFPTEPAVNLILGMSLQENSQDAEAIEAYEIAYNEEPDNIVALNNLAWLYQDSAPERAIELATRAAELYPDNADVLDTYGWILLKQNEREHATQVLERALELAPESAAIAEHLEQARQ